MSDEGTGGDLRTTGRTSLSNDTLALIGGAMPDQPVLYFQAAGAQTPTPFGDGLRCVAGPFVRLGIRLNVNGSSSFPGPVLLARDVQLHERPDGRLGTVTEDAGVLVLRRS